MIKFLTLCHLFIKQVVFRKLLLLNMKKVIQDLLNKKKAFLLCFVVLFTFKLDHTLRVQ